MSNHAVAGRSATLSRSASQNKVGGDYDATRRRSLFITPSASTRNAVRPCSQFEPLALYCWLSECAVSSQGGEARRCPNFEGLKDGSPGQFGIRDARKMGNSRGESLSRSPSLKVGSVDPKWVPHPQIVDLMMHLSSLLDATERARERVHFRG